MAILRMVAPIGRGLTLRLGVALALGAFSPGGAAEALAAEAGVVAADHALASACGAEILGEGGNAVDAAVATALCAGVVQPASSGLGGGGFAVLAGPGLDPIVYDFREVAWGSATPTMFVAAAKGTHPSEDGATAVAVPSESRGLASLWYAHGSLPARQIAAPARRLAREGFAVEAHLASRLEKTTYPEIRSQFSVEGRVAVAGDWLAQPDLARTLQRWARTSGEDLHVGRGARAIVAHLRAGGVDVDPDDLAGTQVEVRKPLVIPWRGYTVVTMPPPSSGGVALAQMLAVLDGYDLQAMGHNTPETLHLLAEVMQHAFADRAHHLGDPDFVEVDVERLLSPARIAEIRGKFSPDATLDVDGYGPLIAPPRDAGTQHISVVDASGMAVALTTTINQSFGSGLVVPGVGVVLNDQMDDFSTAPGTPNGYGLVGSEANAIAPGKRPLSSMSPTLLLDGEGRVVLSVGASGGPTIITGVLQALLNVVVWGMSPADAVAAPRIHHQWVPHALSIEPSFPESTRAALESLGHTLKVVPSMTSVQAVQVAAPGDVRGGCDPRKGGRPAGVPAP
jgi:gamma-glutamyltranspeptidase/glutathione hydrolase